MSNSPTESAPSPLTIKEDRLIRAALSQYCGPVDGVLWAFLSLCIDRSLTHDDRQYIVTHYLGHRDDE